MIFSRVGTLTCPNSSPFQSHVVCCTLLRATIKNPINGHRVLFLAGSGMPGRGSLNFHTDNPSPVHRDPETRASSEERRLVDRPISNRLELVGTEFQVRSSG